MVQMCGACDRARQSFNRPHAPLSPLSIRGLLHRWSGGRWTSEPSPVEGPRGFWGTSREHLWLAGAGGLAHHDGSAWVRVEGPTGPLTEVHGRGDEVWAAGPVGVWVRRKR